MQIDFNKFQGRLPYASELFGIFQPLLGWKSKRSKKRLDKELANNLTKFTKQFKSRLSKRAQDDKLIFEIFDEDATFRVADEIDSLLSREIIKKLNPKQAPQDNEWEEIINPKTIKEYLSTVYQQISDFFDNKLSGLDPSVISYLTRQTLGKTPQLKAAVLPSSIRVVGPSTTTPSPTTSATQPTAELKSRDEALNNLKKSLFDKEKNIAQTLLWYSKNAPATLNILFYQKRKNLTDIMQFIDPLKNFGRTNIDAILSPVGMVHIFRQYFFEFETFLGTPVGHIWISPGGTVELIEISTRKTSTEKSFENSLETTSKSEKESKVQDELADAVKEENRSDIKFGFSASGRYSTPVYGVEASTNLNIDSSKTKSRETTHKQAREQSEKLSEEIKRSFKSTFKVATDTQESSSKRYVIQNTTDKLVNYELRRKMRQVGVQVQDINTQLCWQVFVDDPGQDLGLAKLIHIAEPADLSGLQPPEAPVELQNQSVDLNIQFAYENTEDSEGSEKDVTFYKGDDEEGGLYNNDKIVWHRYYNAEPPAPGYTMDEHIEFEVNHSSTVAAVVNREDDQGKFQITLNQVNFDDKPNINFKITTHWSPPDQSAAKAAYDAKVAEYTNEKQRKQKEAYVKSAQERINMAGSIQTRKFEELREEERILVYRKLIKQLMNIDAEHNVHILSELIRSIFDIDNMLYFVAPEWWKARLHQSHQTYGKKCTPKTGRLVCGGFRL